MPARRYTRFRAEQGIVETQIVRLCKTGLSANQMAISLLEKVPRKTLIYEIETIIAASPAGGVARRAFHARRDVGTVGSTDKLDHQIRYPNIYNPKSCFAEADRPDGDHEPFSIIADKSPLKYKTSCSKIVGFKTMARGCDAPKRRID